MKHPFRCVETKFSKIEYPEDGIMLKMNKKKNGEQAYQERGIEVLSLTS